MKQKRPKIIIVLLVIYVYGFLRGLERVFLFTSNPDYYFFSQAGVEYLFFILSIPIFILTGLTVWFLWKPLPVGFAIAISGLVLEILSSLISFFITLNNPDIAKNAMILYREARGLPVRQDALDTMLSPTGIFVTFGIGIGLNLLIGALVFWKREYFAQREIVGQESNSINALGYTNYEAKLNQVEISKESDSPRRTTPRMETFNVQTPSSKELDTPSRDDTEDRNSFSGLPSVVGGSFSQESLSRPSFGKQPTNVGWVFGSWWVLANITGMMASLILLAMGGLVGVVIGGFVLGIAQWLTLKRHISLSKGWVLATALSWILLPGFIANPSLSNFFWSIIGFGIASIVQWFILKQRVNNSGWWIVVNVFGWSLGWFLAAILDSNYRNHFSSILVTLILAGVIIGGVSGIITGSLLTWVLRKQQIA